MLVAGVDCSTKKISIFFIGDTEIPPLEIISTLDDAPSRIDEMYCKVTSILSSYISDGLKMVYIENSPYLQNIKVTLAIHSAVDAVRFSCVRSRIPYQTVEVTSWKKDVLGNGKADKSQIMSWAKAKYGDLITSQDLADAARIANYGYRRMVK